MNNQDYFSTIAVSEAALEQILFQFIGAVASDPVTAERRLRCLLRSSNHEDQRAFIFMASQLISLKDIRKTSAE